MRAVYAYDLVLGSPFQAQGGVIYWLEVYNTAPPTGNFGWYWLTAPPGNGLSWQRVPPDGEWTSGAQRGFDMAFSLLSQGEGSPIPTVSDWGLIGMAALVLALGGVVFRRVQRRAA